MYDEQQLLTCKTDGGSLNKKGVNIEEDFAQRGNQTG